MEKGIRTGMYFGLTSGVITTLGLIVGLHSGTHSTLAIVGGVLIIAIADSMSDALGIHITKEAEEHSTKHDVWAATIMTVVAKTVVAVSFLLPILLFDLATAIIVCCVWGLSILTLLSIKIASAQGKSKLNVVFEHLLIASLVILVTHYVGDFVANTFS